MELRSESSAATNELPHLIEGSFTLIEPIRVRRLLDEHTFLVPLVLEARAHIDAYFPASQLFLSVVTDPDVAPTDDAPDVDMLVLSIGTRLDVADAMDRLDRLDAQWWLDALPRAKGRMCLNLEFR